MDKQVSDPIKSFSKDSVNFSCGECEPFWPHSCHFQGHSFRETGCYNSSWTLKTGIYLIQKMSKSQKTHVEPWFYYFWAVGTSDKLLFKLLPQKVVVKIQGA